MNDNRLERLDDVRIRIRNPRNVDAMLFADKDVPIESSAVDELERLLELDETLLRLNRLAPGFVATDARLERVAVTPDFHKGAGIPVGTVMATRGFVVPAAIGNDINCGMRLHATSLSSDRVERAIPAIVAAARRTYFQGGRDIAMNRVQREALFREGLPGLHSSVPVQQDEGLWSDFHRQTSRDLDKVDRNGGLRADTVSGLEDFLGSSELTRDNQIGSIGGGNHFVEIQRVERILDGGTAHAWGLKTGMVTVMVHTGSVAIGHLCGGICKNAASSIYPANVKRPDNGVFVLPDAHSDAASRFWNSLHNAANFAFANRMFLALMALKVLRETVADCDAPLVYDAPHNMVWREIIGGEAAYIHRKGACPARGMDEMSGTPFAFYGEPVLVPGSMGASSYVLAGMGNPSALWSASHGAGRKLSRGGALKGNDAEFAAFMKRFHIVTPVDFERHDVKTRPDIIQKKLEDIKKEAPHAYKGIDAIVKTLECAGMARPVAELRPLLTIKG